MDQILVSMLERHRSGMDERISDYEDEDKRDCSAAFERHAQRVAEAEAVYEAGAAGIRGGCRTVKAAVAAHRQLHKEFERRLLASIRLFADDMQAILFRRFGIKTEGGVQ